MSLGLTLKKAVETTYSFCTDMNTSILMMKQDCGGVKIYNYGPPTLIEMHSLHIGR